MKTYANDTPNYTKTHLILKTTLHVRCSLPGKTRWSRDARDHRYIYYVAVASFLFFSKSLPLSRGKYVFELITVIKVIFFTEIQNCKNNWKLLTLLRVIYIKGHNLLSYFLFGKKFHKCFILLPAFYLNIWLMKSPKSSEKIAILKIWQLVFFWGVKTHFGKSHII